MGLFNAYFTEQITVYAYTGENDAGDATLSAAPKTILARVQDDHREVIDKAGNRATSTARIFSAQSIPPRSVVMLNGRKGTVYSCEAMKRLNGTIDHYEWVVV